jgi:hypothetical protein
LLPPRSTAGQLTLDQHIGVRIPGGQPKIRSKEFFCQIYHSERFILARRQPEARPGIFRVSRALTGPRLAAAIKGSDLLDRKPPTLREYANDFLQWVGMGRLEADSRYYINGWRLLGQTKVAGMRMDQISKDEVEKLKFPGSASNGNNALRTLRRMFSKAKEDKRIVAVPDFALFKEHGRSLRLNEKRKGDC